MIEDKIIIDVVPDFSRKDSNQQLKFRYKKLWNHLQIYASVVDAKKDNNFEVSNFKINNKLSVLTTN